MDYFACFWFDLFVSVFKFSFKDLISCNSGLKCEINTAVLNSESNCFQSIKYIPLMCNFYVT